MSPTLLVLTEELRSLCQLVQVCQVYVAGGACWEDAGGVHTALHLGGAGICATCKLAGVVGAGMQQLVDRR